MNKQTHRERFNTVARIYRSEKYPGRHNCLLFVLDYLNPCATDIILDVGCGPGTQLIELAPSIKLGFGIDLSEEMIKTAQERSINHKNLKFLVSSAESILSDFSQFRFTKIYSNYALHHLSEKMKLDAISKLSETLVSGGKFILGDLMFSEDPSQYVSLFEYSGYGPGSDTPSTVSNLEEMFKKAGMRTEIRLLSPISGLIIGTKI
jgi:SAM-dependent methyltransferase